MIRALRVAAIGYGVVGLAVLGALWAVKVATCDLLADCIGGLALAPIRSLIWPVHLPLVLLPPRGVQVVGFVATALVFAAGLVWICERYLPRLVGNPGQPQGRE